MEGAGFEVRFHGRRGQGVVTAAELLAAAAIREGHHAQAFPGAGSERREGAPMVGHCRISPAPIRSRAPIDRPDAVVIHDVTLLHQAGLLSGLASSGFVVVNTTRPLGELAIAPGLSRFDPSCVLLVPASELAMRHLGRPAPEAALLGALAALTGIVPLEALLWAIEDRFEEQAAAGQAAAAREAHLAVTDRRADERSGWADAASA